jgi:hypothetical protein
MIDDDYDIINMTDFQTWVDEEDSVNFKNKMLAFIRDKKLNIIIQ